MSSTGQDQALGAAHIFHQLTSYSPAREWTDPIDDERLVADLEVNDLSRWPYWHKRYDDAAGAAVALTVVALPRDLPATDAPATVVLAGTAGVEAAPLDLAGLARLLFLSAGVVRTGERPGRTIYFRAAGSAGGRFPLEVYVAIPAGSALPAGVHWYDPGQHALLQIGPPPVGSAPALIVTGVPWRTGWRYRERGLRHIYWDAGTLLAQQLALADSAGLPARLYTRFPDAAATELVGADGVHEFPVAVVQLGAANPDLVASGPAVAGRVDGDPLEFPLVTATQHAGDLDRWDADWPRGAAVEAADGEEPVESVVLRRGSQRRMDPNRSVPLSLLQSSLAASLRGIELPHYILVHAVDGLAAGLYRWPDLAEPVRAGALREEAYRICLDQGLARDAAFVVIGAADISRLGDRDYRDAQLASGLVEGRLHLMAYAMGASATGMTFLDSEIAGLLGEPLDGLLFTCVGVPDYRSTAGGPPGAPVSVQNMAPR
ncbi:MAG: hypothetical protein JWN95_1291 [Frankiales bacterium]|nr:hypothetical protein [Frankiales bacterium]